MRSWMILVIVFLGVIGSIIMGIFVYAGNTVDSAFNLIDFNINGQNFTQVYDNTLGQGVNAFLSAADAWGILILFGMVFLVLLSSYYFSTKKRLWIVAEIFILVATFITTVSLQNSYNSIINSNAALFNVFANHLTKTSTFILNLHLIVPIVWGLCIVLTYGILQLNKKENLETSGVGF